MIDAGELKARAERARQFELEVEAGKRFTLRVPTQYELVLAERRVRAAHPLDPVAPLLLQRALTESAVVGWTGLVVADALADQADGDQALEFDAQLVRLVLDEHTKWSLQLGAQLFDRIVARNAAAAEDAKN